MIDVKPINFISGDNFDVNIGISRIVDFLELTGRNIIYFQYRDNCNISDISKVKYYNNNELIDSLNEEGVLFRINLIIVDMPNQNIDDVVEIQIELDKKGIDYIILTNNFNYITPDEKTGVYKITSEKSDIVINHNIGFSSRDIVYYITDMRNNEKYSFDSYQKKYIRNKKIDDIINDD